MEKISEKMKKYTISELASELGCTKENVLKFIRLFHHGKPVHKSKGKQITIKSAKKATKEKNSPFLIVAEIKVIDLPAGNNAESLESNS